MAKIRVGINGFGRIGRQVFRIMKQQSAKFDLVGIHDLAPVDALAHLLKYDSVYGRYPGKIEVKDGKMIVDGDVVNINGTKAAPGEFDWGGDVDVVVESTGIFASKAKDGKPGYDSHLGKNGCKKVLLTVPAKDEIDGMIVLGVNDADLTPAMKCISNASCTTNCLAPVAKAIHNAVGIKEGLMTTVHAYTNDQKIADQIHSDLRRARAGAINTIPTTTGAAKAVGKVFKPLAGKLNGYALRVPVITGSLVDLTFTAEKNCSVEDVNKAVKAAAEGPMKGILSYCVDPIVSTDIIGDCHSSIYDALSTMKIGDNMFKVLSWYDNEWGYSNRVVELIEKAMKL
jgi:glyceraldehyde 3-phosphate dehydrogenase